jgi:hypothetical protein
VIALAERQGSIDWWIIAAVLLVWAIAATIRAFHRVPAQRRAYTGPVRPDAEAWYTPVLPYFGQRRDSAERVARAVDHAVYPDPKKGAAPVRVAGSVNTRRTPDVKHQ